MKIKLQSSLTAMSQLQTSTTFLFWVSSHETQQAFWLNKDHCSSAGQRKVQSFSLPFFYSTQHGCHLTPPTQKRHHPSATSSFTPKGNIAFKGTTILIRKRQKFEKSLPHSVTPTTDINWTISEYNSSHLNVMWATRVCFTNWWHTRSPQPVHPHSSTLLHPFSNTSQSDKPCL